MSKPVKIFELNGQNWADGLSQKTSAPIGGLFSAISNVDPFETPGFMQPTLQSALASDISLTMTPRQVTSWNSSGTTKLYAHSDDKLYEVVDGSPYTTTNKTTEITVTSSFRGAIIYNNKYLYHIKNGGVYSNSLPVASGSNVKVFGTVRNDGVWHPFCRGADNKIYVADAYAVHRLNSVTALDNTGADAALLPEDMIVRHMVNDGRYLVILADNNASGVGTTPTVPVSGRYRCQVLFWDMIKSTFDQIYDIEDSYLIGGAFLDGGVYIFGGDNMYVCNIATPPKTIFSFKSGSTITEKPQTPFQITQNRNSIYWCGQSNGAIYAYGSLFNGTKKVFYQPFNSSDTPSAITTNGTNFYIGTSGTNAFLKVTGTGSTRNASSVTTAPIILPQPYKFSHIKVVMEQPLSLGDSIDAVMTSMANSETVTASNPQTTSTVSAKQSIIFERKASVSTEFDHFEDFQLTVSSNKAVARVEVWAIPLEPMTQTL